jgi:uncharacterized protein with von Willebrand factor type A (vWA) domain
VDRTAIVPLDDEPGRAIDGHALVAEAVGFGRALRAAGLSVDLGAAVDFARALTLVDVGDRSQVHGAGAAIFVRRRDDREAYDLVFRRWWRVRGRRLPGQPPLLRPPDDAEPADAESDEEGAIEGDERRRGDAEPRGLPVPADADDATDAAEIEGVVVAPDAYSGAEQLRHRDFDRMTSAELRDAERFIDLLGPRLETRRTRRYELHAHGRRLAPRAMFRRNLATGELTEWIWRRQVRRPRPIVVLCDISGSMERHSRLLLRFVQALAAANQVRTESFVFGTRLTRVTRVLRDRDRDRALGRVADAVNDWAGGTRIGESFREFNLRWARRTLRTSGVVIVISDGWDRGDPNLVATETARLRRNCHRLVWLNPLAGTPGYQPLAAGMRAAYPYIDDFLAAGTLASLERLGEILAGAGPGRRGADAVHETSAARLASAADRRLVTAPLALGDTTDPAAARPLR